MLHVMKFHRGTLPLPFSILLFSILSFLLGILPFSGLTGAVGYTRIGEKPRIIQPLQSETVIAGQPALFYCQVEGNPSPRVQWTVSGMPVQGSRFGEVLTMPRGSVLRISNSLLTLQGAVVACVAENALGHAEMTARLSIYKNEEAAPSGFPRFLNVFSVIVAKKNDRVELECRTQGDPPPSIRWFKDSIPIDFTGTRFTTTAVGSLEISHVVEEDEGKYECATTNIHGTRFSPGESLMVRDDVEATLQLLAPKTHRFKPHFTSVPAPLQVVAPGGHISLGCSAVGAPVPTVAWFEAGEQMYRYMLDQQPPGTAMLTLKHVNNSLNVTCIARSNMGQIKHQVAIIVKELPATPGVPNFLYQKRSGEVMIAFARPPTFQKPSAPISNFLIQWIETNNFLPEYLVSLSPEIAAAMQPLTPNNYFGSNPLVSNDFKQDRSDIINQVGLHFQILSAKQHYVDHEITCRLTGLKAYTNYTVWCRSIGPDGDASIASKYVHFMTEPEVPTSPPIQIQASAISNAAVSVSWEEPLEANGPITMYRVYYTDKPARPLAEWKAKMLSVDQDNTVHDLNSTGHLALLTHLKSNLTYYIRVSASNIKGDGPPSMPYPVIVRPGALPPPVNLKAIAKSAHEVSLVWETPQQKYDQSPLVNFELLITATGQTVESTSSRRLFIEPSSTSYLVTGLLPDTNYEFRLAAVSESGAGIQAKASAKTKEYVPGPPYSIVLQPIGSDRLRVTWTPPKETAAALPIPSGTAQLKNVYYELELRITDFKGNWLSPADFHPIRQQVTVEQEIEESRGRLTYSREISGLKPRTFYEAYLRAVARSGTGDRGKSGPSMTWPLAPGSPSNMSLQPSLDARRNRVLIVNWEHPVQMLSSNEQGNVSQLKYRIRWNLLLDVDDELEDLWKKSQRKRRQAIVKQAISEAQAKQIGIPIELISNEVNVSKMSWESPVGSFLGGLTYEIRVAAMDDFQAGEEAVERIELPDDAPSHPPFDLGIDPISPHLLLNWKAPPLAFRNGRFLSYEVECAWVDVVAGFKDWESRRINWTEVNESLTSSKRPESTLFWPSGQVSLLNVSKDAKPELSVSFGTVFRGRVRAYTPGGPGPWSGFETLSLNKLMPLQPTSVAAILIGKSNDVHTSWAMPDQLLQTSFDPRRQNMGPLIYRQFAVEFALKSLNNLEPTVWQRRVTTGPVTSLTLFGLNQPQDYVVRVRSIGLANLHSGWSLPVHVLQTEETNTISINNLKCQAIMDPSSEHAELELTWNPIDLPRGARLLHYLVNFTGNSIFLDSNGHKIRKMQSQREQSLRASSMYPSQPVTHRLVGLQFNTAYEIDVVPSIRSKISTVPSLPFGEGKSVFCRTSAKRPQFVPAPEFISKPPTSDGIVTIYRANERDGSITNYEIIVRDRPTSQQGFMVLAKFPAVNLFPPLRKVVRILLNGTSEETQSNVFSAPSLVPGQEHDLAIRACVEGQQTSAHVGMLTLEEPTSPYCAISEWIKSSSVYHSKQTSQRRPEVQKIRPIIIEDPLWPSSIYENLTSLPPQKPFNDAASGPLAPLENSGKLWAESELIPLANQLEGELPVENDGVSRIPRMRVLVAGISIVSLIGVLAVICFIGVYYCRRSNYRTSQHPGSSFTNIKAVNALSPPPRSNSQSTSNLVNGYSILHPETPTQKRADMLSLQSSGFNYTSQRDGYSNNAGITTIGSVSSSQQEMQRNYSERSIMDVAGYSDSLRFKDVRASTEVADSIVVDSTTGGFYGRQISSISETSCGCSHDVDLTPSRLLTPPPPPPPYFMQTSLPQATHILSSPITRVRSPIHNGMLLDGIPCSIPVSDLVAHVTALKLDQGRLMAREFESIDPGGQFTWENSSKPNNRPKNRYANVVAYDHSRVVLQRLEGEPDSDYINANYLDGYNRKNMYIATQGPLPNTITDFWRMIWERGTSSIVAMTRLEERTRIKCEQYWPTSGLPTRHSPTTADGLLTNGSVNADRSGLRSFGLWTRDRQTREQLVVPAPVATTTYGQITVSLLDVVELAYYTIRTFSLQKCGSREKREVRQLQFTAWPDHGVPNHPAPLLMFLRRVNAEYQSNTGPIVVHCSAGVGRTGAFIVLDVLLQQMRYEQTINVFSTVSELRSQRNFIVQTEDQYAFIYEALVEASLSGNTELPARQLRNHWLKLTLPCNEVAPATDGDGDALANTGLALEFDQLVSQSINTLAKTIAHKNPGGLLSYVDLVGLNNVQLGPEFGDAASPICQQFGSTNKIPTGSLMVNMRKNRLPDCIPYDTNRVKLAAIRGVDGSDYINASYIDSYRSRAAFIATQTPFEDGFDDFWRMIWETNSCLLVQLDQTSDKSFREITYWPTKMVARFGFLLVEPVAEFAMPAYVLREFRLTDARDGQSRTIRLFDASELASVMQKALTSSQQHSSVLGGDYARATLPPSLPPLADWLPTSRAATNNTHTFGYMAGGNYSRSKSVESYKNTIFDDRICQKASLNIIDLIEQVHKTQEQFGLDGPITVHCNTGTGNTGIFLALSITFERMRFEGVVDMFQTIKLLWWQRSRLVEFPTEFAFCYATALEYLNFYEVNSGQHATLT